MKPTLNRTAQLLLEQDGYTPIDRFWGKVSLRVSSNCYRVLTNWKHRFSTAGLSVAYSEFKFEGGAKNPYGTQCMYVGAPKAIVTQYQILTGVRKEVE